MEVVKHRIAQLQEFVKGYMVQGEDYGVIPGTPKPTLLKPGAEKLCDIYALTPSFEVTHRLEDWDKPLFHYEVRCTLNSRQSGIVIAQGLGSANSKESRYADRWLTEKKARMEGVDITGLPYREKDGQYGTYREYRVENRDPFTLINTLLKMAKKRALVDVVLSATRSSGIFTQDIEDMDLGTRPAAKPEEKAATGRPAAPAGNYVSDAQLTLINRLIKAKDGGNEFMSAFLMTKDVQSVQEISKADASELITQLKEQPDRREEDAR